MSLKWWKGFLWTLTGTVIGGLYGFFFYKITGWGAMDWQFWALAIPFCVAFGWGWAALKEVIWE